MARLEQEIWIAQFAALLQRRRPDYERVITEAVGESLWHASGVIAPDEAVSRFLQLLSEAEDDTNWRRGRTLLH